MSELRRGLAVALAIARKDATSELRGRQATGSTLFFAAIVLLLFGFALGPDAQRLAQAAPGLLWLAIVFGGLLTMARLHQLEAEDGALEQLALYPVDRRAIYAGKALAGAAAMLVLGGLLVPVVAILYAVPLGAGWLPLLAAVVLGAIGFAAVGTAYAGLTVRMRAREVMLPLLLLPLVVPIFIAGVKVTGRMLAGKPLADVAPWLNLMVGFDVIFLVVGWLVFEYAVEE